MATGRVNAKSAARQSTREALLRAATQMLFEAPAADPIGALKPVEIARRAVPPRSNGAFYNIWPTKDDFRRDLLHHVLSVDRVEVGEPTTDGASGLTAQEDFSFTETVRVVANLNFDGLQDETSLRLKQALWSRHTVDPDISHLLAGQYDGVTTMLTPMYQAVLDRAGRRMRPPYTVELLAITLAALAEGLQMRRSVQPSAVPDDLGPDADPEQLNRRWSLFAAAVNMIFSGMTVQN